MAAGILDFLFRLLSGKKEEVPPIRDHSAAKNGRSDNPTRTVDEILADIKKRTDARHTRSSVPEPKRGRSYPAPLNVREEFRQTRSIVKPNSPGVRHPEAIYRDEAKRWHTIDYTELADQRTFLKAKLRELFTPDHSLRLQARLGPGIPHFYHPSDDRQTKINLTTEDRFDDVPENNIKAHEARIATIIKAIEYRDPQKVVTIDFSSEATSPQFTLANINGYTWSANSTRMKLAGAIVCPDIIGSLSDQSGTENHPKVFVEVVNTHFPSENTWNAYLKASMNDNDPVIVCFDFMSNYHFSARKEDEEAGRQESDLRTIYYIWQGSLWKNTTRMLVDKVDYTSQNFKTLMDVDSHRPKPKGTALNGSGLDSGPL